ncbi:glycosyltransferase family 2 protein [Fusobacterium sp. 1001295B_180824_G3]|uniref:glycosyltransferase family 2 protein n=1 Tax=Fusobacterium sp. 1001295B_180824_G3 TaxID=2787123 RepID=UPI001899FAE3|nr:glycosyltransferase family 2 protein [Fusobacterium sp. 1001295B_180824_G3]
MKDKILLFIPMFNCEKQITRVLNQINVKVREYITETIVIDNRSTDDSKKKVINFMKVNKDKNIKLFLNDENYNLGGSHKVAFKYAIENSFDYIIVLHGDDQGNLSDFIPLLEKNIYQKYDCCLGARFMKDSKLNGYSLIRIWGNYIFNWLFSMVVKEKVYDLGSGLNMYSVKILKNEYYKKFPDTLYFNNCMLLASYYYKHNLLFYPISWKEDDQISNNKLIKFSISLLKMLKNYKKDKKKYITSEMREKNIENYKTYFII